MNTFEIPIDLPNVEIQSVESNNKGDIIITVKTTEKSTSCRNCGRKITKCVGHDDPIELRHLSILGRKTYIRIYPVRYKCIYCKDRPTTTQRLSWHNQRSPHTKAYEEYLLLCMVNSTVADVSIKQDVGYDSVLGVIDRYVLKKVNWAEIDRIDLLGIDEISLRKGHQDFVTLITSRLGDKTRILGVLPDRKKETVKAFFLSIPWRLRKSIKGVCSDLYEGFINAAKEVFGKRVPIVADRFHVAKLYRKGLDGLRKKEMKRLKEELSEQDYEQLKGAMWALRKRDLTKEERLVLDRLFSYSPVLELAYELCNDLTEIFDTEWSRVEARASLRVWIRDVEKKGVRCFDKFVKTLKKFFDEITNYFRDRATSGFVEGLNNKVKVLKRRSYGIKKPDHLFQRLYLDLRGYELYA